MPSDDAHQADRPAPISIPDQLQQAKGSDRSRPGEDARQREPAEAPPSPGGVLGQLETERAHD